MTDAADPTTEELRQLATSALRFEAHRPFQALFPHLATVPDRRIDRPRSTSQRLRNALVRWHGLTWQAYLGETPATLRRRPNVGLRAVGEFIHLAVVAAEPDAALEQDDDTGKTDAAHDVEGPSSDPRAPRIQAARRFLETVEVKGEMPIGSTLREIARLTIAFGDDLSFQELFPYLPQFAIEVVDLRADAAPKFLSVLRGWNGFRWAGYLEKTPASFLRRRNGGPTSLGAILWCGARLATVTPPGSSGYPPSHARADQSEAVGRIAGIVDRSTDRERAIIDGRLAALERRKTLAELGRDAGVTRERMRQHQDKVIRRLGREIARRDSVARVAMWLGDSVGSAWSATALGELPGLEEPALADLERVETRLLLWLAGPFVLVDGWLVHRPGRRPALPHPVAFGTSGCAARRRRPWSTGDESGFRRGW